MPSSHHHHHHHAAPSYPTAGLVEIFDAEFKYAAEVDASLITHYPPARLNITRLVFCRNYVAGDAASCAMGDACKFVHADVDMTTLETHPIHVKYAWRAAELCTYPRLPAGEMLAVASPNARDETEQVPSELVLVTRGALARHEHGGAALSHCAHYYFNRMCNRGERCNFIHVVHVDPTVVGDFKRAPARNTQPTTQLHQHHGQHGQHPPAYASFQHQQTAAPAFFSLTSGAAPAVPRVGAFATPTAFAAPQLAAVVSPTAPQPYAAAAPHRHHAHAMQHPHHHASSYGSDHHSSGSFNGRTDSTPSQLLLLVPESAPHVDATPQYAAAAAAPSCHPRALETSGDSHHHHHHLAAMTSSDDTLMAASDEGSSVDVAEAHEEEFAGHHTAAAVAATTRQYRHNPYSLMRVTVWVQ